MTRISVPWTNGGSLELTLPRGWRLLQVVEPAAAAPIADLPAAVDAALDYPVGMPALELINLRLPYHE